METTFTAKEINIMTITIGLRADKVSKEGNFVAERNYYYCVDASWKENFLTSGSETLKYIKGLIKKGLMQEKKENRNGSDILCYELSDSGKKLLEEIFSCRITEEKPIC